MATRKRAAQHTSQVIGAITYRLTSSLLGVSNIFENFREERVPPVATREFYGPMDAGRQPIAHWTLPVHIRYSKAHNGAVFTTCRSVELLRRRKLSSIGDPYKES